MVKLFAHCFESISILLWLHICYRKPIRGSIGEWLFCGLLVLFYYPIDGLDNSVLVSVLPAIFVLFWIVLSFKEKLVSTIGRYIICLIGIGVSQLVSVVLINILMCFIRLSEDGMRIGAYIINLFISVTIYFVLKDVKLRLPKPNISVMVLFLYVLGMLIFIKYDSENSGGLYGKIYIVHMLLIVVFVLVVLNGQRNRYELAQKRLELELKNKYEEVYSLLLLEMRRKQHDYKNQISALYSLQLVGSGNRELFEQQKEYGDELLQSAKFDNLILECSSPVLSGYIYTKCKEAERIGIDIEPSIKCNNFDYSVGIHEIIEILGILINNAIEYVVGKDWEYNTIRLEIVEKLDKLHIMVSNVAEYVSYDAMEKMFSLGYSTKGEERGLGLYSLKNIVMKGKGELLVENTMELGVNWFNIKVVI